MATEAYISTKGSAIAVSGNAINCYTNNASRSGDQCKNAIFTYSICILTPPPFGVIPSEFRRDLLRHKTRVLWLSCG